MSKPVYLLVIQQGMSEAWHQLSEEEQKSLWGKVQEVDRRAGANYLGGYSARWSSEEVEGFGIIEYPDIDKYQKKVEELEALNWWRYFRGKTILGTKDPNAPTLE